MKQITILLLFVFFVVLTANAQNADLNAMPSGLSGSYGTEETKVIKVFSAENAGFKFRAYQVKWKNQDVVVSDPLGTSNYKEGENITFMAQSIELPSDNNKTKTLSFMVMDFKGLSSKK